MLVMFPLVMFPAVMLSPCAYALEIPVVSKNPVVDSAIVAPKTANAVNTTKIARFVLDDMLGNVKSINLYKYFLMDSYRKFNSTFGVKNII
jgi:hypothetical protein